MESRITAVKAAAAGEIGVIELINILRDDEAFELTPLNFMRLLSEDLSVSFIQSRKLISLLTPEMRPLASPDEVEQQWGVILRLNS